MGLATRSKRASSVGLLSPFVLAPPLPDGAIQAEDRHHIAGCYAGELAPKVTRVTGGGTVVVDAAKGVQEEISVSGGGVLFTAGVKGAIWNGGISAGGTVALDGRKGALGLPSVGGSGTVQVAGLFGARRAIRVQGAGDAVSDGCKGAHVEAQLSGGGTGQVTYTRFGGVLYYAVFSGGGGVIGEGTKAARAPPVLSGGGRLFAGGVCFAQVEIRAPEKYAPVRLVYLRMDYCGNVFGVEPCLAAGTPCYNTWKTCKYLSAFSNVGRTYKFSEVDAAVPFQGIRPYVKSVRLLPTEIKTNLTVNARVSVVMVDEMDQDIDSDPYVAGPGKI